MSRGRIIFGLPQWKENAVSAHVAEAARGLAKLNFDTRVLITQADDETLSSTASRNRCFYSSACGIRHAVRPLVVVDPVSRGKRAMRLYNQPGVDIRACRSAALQPNRDHRRAA